MPRNLIPSDASIKAAVRREPPLDRLPDGDGLYLRLRVKGGPTHAWRFAYTRPNGRRNEISLGTYPEVGLAEARRKAEEARSDIARGVDPSEKRQSARQALRSTEEARQRAAAGLPPRGSFEDVARDWWQRKHCATVSAGHAERTLRRFVVDVFPWIGSRPIGEIGTAEMLAVLRRIEGRGALETAHRTKDSCSQVFRYAAASGLCEVDPTAILRDALPPVRESHFAALVNPDAVAGLLRAIEGYSGQPVTRAGLKLSALLFLRPGELRHLEWSWIDWEGRQIRVPSHIMKRRLNQKANGADHVVPLAPQALALLRELQALTGRGHFVFPALTTADRPMSENTIRAALRRMGYSNDDMTAHGFRAMARTMAVERLGVAPEVVEAQLAHAVTDSLGRAYNRTQYLEQRRDLMVKWANYLDWLRDGGDVVPLKGAA